MDGINHEIIIFITCFNYGIFFEFKHVVDIVGHSWSFFIGCAMLVTK
jgi:hypothetical protein